jgi:hypothetical protein
MLVTRLTAATARTMTMTVIIVGPAAKKMTA